MHFVVILWGIEKALSKQSVKSELPVAVFDSGVGGLSALESLIKILPSEKFVFLADEAWLPYGDKPWHDITQRVHHVGQFFHEFSCKALVIACNTATAAGASALRQTYPDWPIVGIEPAVKPASMMSKTGKVGILATANTVASERFKNLVARFDEVAEVLARPCTGLVELIESAPISKHAVRELLRPHVDYLKAQGADVIVLGCTHYPFVSDVVEALAGPGVQILETGLPVARQLKVRLEQAGLLSDRAKLEEQFAVQFLTSTNTPDSFQDKLIGLLGEKWSGAEVKSVRL